jgi:hypothetical protein
MGAINHAVVARVSKVSKGVEGCLFEAWHEQPS